MFIGVSSRLWCGFPFIVSEGFYIDLIYNLRFIFIMLFSDSLILIAIYMIFYFSGTGNSRWVAESLGKRLEDAVEDIADVKIEKEEYTLPEGEILGFVFPVYAWAPPTIVMDFISLLRLSSAPKYVFFVCTCGDDSGKTADIFVKQLKRKVGNVTQDFL